MAFFRQSKRGTALFLEMFLGQPCSVALTMLLTADFVGVVTCDRAKMYWQVGQIQWCWAHLQRDFQAWSESSDRVVQRLGRDLLRPTNALFRL